MSHFCSLAFGCTHSDPRICLQRRTEVVNGIATPMLCSCLCHVKEKETTGGERDKKTMGGGMKPTADQIKWYLARRTYNPMAPLIVQNMADAIEKLSELMVPMANEEETQALASKIMDQFLNPDDELDNPIIYSPSMIIALCSLLKTSMTTFTASCVPGFVKPGSRKEP